MRDLLPIAWPDPLGELPGDDLWERWYQLLFDTAQVESVPAGFGCWYESLSLAGSSVEIRIADATRERTFTVDLDGDYETSGLGAEITFDFLREGRA